MPGDVMDSKSIRLQTLLFAIFALFTTQSTLLADWNNRVLPTTTNVVAVCSPIGGSNQFVLFPTLLYYSTNNGSTWATTSSPFSNSATSMFFLDNLNGYVTNSTGNIATTTNGGGNWAIITIPNFSINSVNFFSVNNGITVGNNGKIYYTNDGGASWNLGTSPTTQNINSVCMLSNSIAFAVCDNGVVIKTTNGGITWANNTNLGATKLNSVSFVNSTNGVISGNTGLAFITTNGGSTWGQSNTGVNTNINAISYTTNSTLYAAGNNGMILKSTDAGSTWFAQNSNAGTNNINSISFKSSEIGLAGGANGLVITTTNGGRIFNPVVHTTSPTLGGLYKIGSDLTISWTSSDITNVLIRYSSNGGADNYSNTIGTFNASAGTTSLNLNSSSFTTTNNGRILISDLANANVNDTSGAFVIDDWVLATTSFNTASTFYSSSTINLNWVSSNISVVNIEYQNNNTGVWTPLAINYSATLNTYAWILPEIANANVRFRIYDPNKTYRADTTKANLTILNPSLQITSPNGGEVYNYPSNVNITWNSTPNLANVDIEYSRNNGTSWISIQTNVDATLQNYSWAIPNFSSTNNLIRIKRSGTNQFMDTSNAVFRTNGIPLQINTPISGAKWKVGAAKVISWTADNSISEVNIDYTTDGGSTWKQVAKNILATDVNYTWTIPNEPTSLAKIRISNASNTTTNVVSALFSIVNLRLNAALDNKTIIVTTNENLSWTSFGLDFVNLKYRLNSSASWTPIQSNLGANSSLTWTVPDTVTSTAKLRVEYVSDTTIASEANINLVRANFTPISPALGSYLKSGSTTQITWSSAYITILRVDYRTSSTTSWNLITNNASASIGRVNWNVPSVMTDDAQLRFTYSVGNNPSSIQVLSDLFSISNADVILTSPNGGERMVPGTVRQIKWKYSNLTNVDLLYTTDGTNYIDIPSGQGLTASTQLFNWTIPNTPTLIAKIKIRNSNAPIINDVSDTTFAISGVRVTAPVTSTQLLVGSVINVRWQSALVNRVDIFYTIDNGTNWLQIAKDYPAASGNFAWQVPNNPSSVAIIKVVDSENSTLKDSVSSLTLQGLTITKPDSTNNWLIGEDYGIEWRSAALGEVKIEYSTNGGTNWITIMSNLNATDGTFTWNVPKTPVDTAIVRITHLENPNFFNLSKKFKIRGNGIVVKSPIAAQSFSAASSTFVVPITWSYANVSTVNIQYSTNRGADWQTVANGVNASDRSYSWILDAATVISSKEYKIRIVDAENSSIRDSSGIFSIKGVSNYTVPKNWEYASGTGNNAIIIIPNRSGIIPTVLDVNINMGDAIGLFYTLNGEQKCAGYAVYDTNYNTAITVWGDNPTTTIKDGFAVNEVFAYKIWDSNTGLEYNANATYSSGNSVYTSSVTSLGVSILSSLKGYKRLTATIRANRWALISSNLIPRSLTMDSMIASIRPKLTQVKDENGRIFMPSQSINQLSTWDLSTGYEVYTNSDATWTIEGSSITPINYAKTLVASQWHIIAYLRQDPATPATIFAPYTNYLIMAKDADGNIYYPAFGINTIGMMNPGQGYKVVSNTTFGGFRTEISTQNHTPLGKVFKLDDAEPETVFFKSKMKSTGSSAVAVVKLPNIEFGDEVGVFNSNNELIGSSFCKDVTTPIIIWGDDTSTPKQDGAVDGEMLHIQLWKRKENKIYALEIKKLTDIVSGGELGNSFIYAKDAIISAECAIAANSIKSVEDGLFVVSPNPAKDFVNVSSLYEFSKIRIIDLLGKVVLETENKSNSKLELDLKTLSKGAYTIEIQTQTGVSYQKLLIQ